MSTEEIHGILSEIDTTYNGRLEMSDYLQVIGEIGNRRGATDLFICGVVSKIYVVLIDWYNYSAAKLIRPVSGLITDIFRLFGDYSEPRSWHNL